MSRTIFLLCIMLLSITVTNPSNHRVETNADQEKIGKLLLKPLMTRDTNRIDVIPHGKIKLRFKTTTNSGSIYKDYEIRFNFSSFHIVGNATKFVIYGPDRLIYGAPLHPPVSYTIKEIALPMGLKCVDVETIDLDAIVIEVPNIARQPQGIIFNITNYTKEFERINKIPPVESGIYPREPVLNWMNDDGKLRIMLATIMYNLTSNEAYLLQKIHIRVYLEEMPPVLGNRDFDCVDAIIIVSPRYYEYAVNFSLYHPEYNIGIVNTDWIFQNFDEAEMPSLSGFASGNQPLRNVLASKYNYSLALRIISFLRSIRNSSVKYIILMGNVIDVPPSYYYWDSCFYAYYKNAEQSWIPTDIFYASPDYDYYPEFAVSRIPFIGEQDISTYINKVKNWLYEFYNNKTWVKKIAVVGGMPFGTLYYSGEATILDIINSGYLGNLTIEKYFETNAKYTTENVRMLYKGGRIFILQFSHGTETSFVKLSKFDHRWIKLIDNRYLDTLQDASQLPIVVAPACSSGAYDYGIFDGNLKHSFSQAMIFSRAGGIAYVGMSRIAYGALSFYFDNGLLKAPYLLFAQAFLKLFFEAIYENSSTLGEAFKYAIREYAFRNNMWYSENLRTLMEAMIVGDPLLPLPRLVRLGDPPKVDVLRESRRWITIPLTFGQATEYKESNIIELNVTDSDLVEYVLVSPMFTKSFSEPFARTTYMNASPIGIAPPSGGVYILKIIDETGMEQRMYIRGKGAEFKNITIELLDTDGNGKFEFMRINTTIDFGYYSIDTTIWGFRAWLFFSYANEGKNRINQNIYIRSADIGEQTLTFMFDNGPLAGDGGVLKINYYFFSWWPWLYTWWYSGPGIWTEFRIEIIVSVPPNSLESAISIVLEDIEPRSVDGDTGIEVVDLYFRIKLNFRIDGYIEAMLYLRRYVIGESGGRVYLLSSFLPYIIHSYKQEVLIKYAWGLRSWYSRGSWGKPPTEEEALITHYYSFSVSLRTREHRLAVLTMSPQRIYELDNLTSDDSDTKDIIIEKVYAAQIFDPVKNVSDIRVTMAGYSIYPHFERTEMLIQKKVDDSWQTIYTKELAMGIFIFYWPGVSTEFKICNIPVEFLGEGEFRVLIRAYKYVGSNKVILAQQSAEFNVTQTYNSFIESLETRLVDRDGDGQYGHIDISIKLYKGFDEVSISYDVSYSVDGTETRIAKDTIRRHITNSIDISIGIRGDVLEDIENFSLIIRLKISCKNAEYMHTIPISREIVMDNLTGDYFEDSLMDSDKSFFPAIIIRNMPYIVNKSYVDFGVMIYSLYSMYSHMLIMVDSVCVYNISEYNDTIMLDVFCTGLSEGEHNLTIAVTGANKISIIHNFIVDLSPPIVNLTLRSPWRELALEWSTSDLSGVSRVEIYLNNTLIFTSNMQSGEVNLCIEDGEYEVMVVFYDLAGWSTSINKSVIIDSKPPRIILMEPNTTDITTDVDQINISWEIVDEVPIGSTRLIIDYVHILYPAKPHITLSLHTGENIIIIEAIDIAGNSNRIVISILVSPSPRDGDAIDQDGCEECCGFNESISYTPKNFDVCKISPDIIMATIQSLFLSILLLATIMCIKKAYKRVIRPLASHQRKS